MIPVIGAVVSLIGGVISDEFKGWRDRRQAKVEAQVAVEKKKIEIIESQAIADINWDVINAENAKDSMKDEWWTILLSVPLVLVFFEDTRPSVIEGFNALNDLPEWYIIAVGVAIGAAFGYRKIVDYIRRK